MSDLNSTERQKLEKVFGMSGGYVLDFSNQTLEEFVHGSVGINISDAKYIYGSGSKAKRIRALWKNEPNYVVGKLIRDLLAYCRPSNVDSNLDSLLVECERIVTRLLGNVPLEAMSAIDHDDSDRAFELLTKAVKESIEKNEPEVGLDRLHTFVSRLIRKFAVLRGVIAPREKPLQSVLGEYIKLLKRDGLIESEMSERILKFSISTMEAFNHVRNEKSLAHDNFPLNHEESVFIFNHVCSVIRFVKALEAKAIQIDGSEVSADTNPF